MALSRRCGGSWAPFDVYSVTHVFAFILPAGVGHMPVCYTQCREGEEERVMEGSVGQERDGGGER